MVDTVKTVRPLKTVEQVIGDITRLKLTDVSIQIIYGKPGKWLVRATQGTIGHNFEGTDLEKVWEAMVRILGASLKNKS